MRGDGQGKQERNKFIPKPLIKERGKKGRRMVRM